MKNLKTVVVVMLTGLLLNATSLMADCPPENEASAQSDLYKALEDVMDYPENIEDKTESSRVWVTFDVKEDGSIDAKCVEGDQKFTKHVKDELRNVHVDNPYLTGRTFMIRIAFEYTEQ